MPLVILTVILPDPDATRVPWGVNPAHVVEVTRPPFPQDDEHRALVTITRGARNEGHEVIGTVAEVVALLNRDPDALGASPYEHPTELLPDFDPAAWQARRLAAVAPAHVTEADRAALDRLAAMLRFPTWPGASAIEDVAEVIWTVRDEHTGPVVDDWPSH